jgi:hypothetical protein
MLYNSCMSDQATQKKSKKRPRDPSQLALAIVNEATEEQSTSETLSTPTENDSEKNPAAVILGRLGGIKGGPARAKKLSKKKRHEIAQKAAKARWKGKTAKKRKS